MGIRTAVNKARNMKRTWRTPLKANRVIFYCVSLLTLLPVMIKEASLIGLVAAGILLIALLVFICLDRDSEPAGAQMMVLFFFNILVRLALHYDKLTPSFNLNAGLNHLKAAALLYLGSPFCIALTGVGAVLGVIGLWHKSLWLTGFSGAALGTAVILLVWSSGNLVRLQFTPNGMKILAAFLQGVFIWMFLSRIALYAAPGKWWLHMILSILLLCGLAALHLLELTYVWFLSTVLPDTFFAWEKIILACGSLLVCALVMANGRTERANFDALTALVCAVFIFAVKFLSCTYFAGRWLFLLPLTASMLRCLKNTAADNTTLGLHPLTYMVIQTAVFFSLVKALEMGLYINVILATIAGLALWIQQTKKRTEKLRDFSWGVLITFFAAEAMAWQWRMRFSMEGLLLLAVIFMMAMGVLMLVNSHHPNKVQVPRSVQVCVCACAGILCLISMFPTLWIQADVRDSETYIEVKVFNGSTAAKISYCWKDWRGQAIEEAELQRQNAVLPIKGNILTVTAVDEKGIQGRRNFWYPIWPSPF